MHQFHRELESNARNTLESYLYQGRTDLRNVRLFQYNRQDLPQASPVELIIRSMASLQNAINLTEETSTTKSKIKKEIEIELKNHFFYYIYYNSI